MRLECGEIERKFLLSLMKTNERDVKINIVSERKENRSMTMKICLCVRFLSFFWGERWIGIICLCHFQFLNIAENVDEVNAQSGADIRG